MSRPAPTAPGTVSSTSAQPPRAASDRQAAPAAARCAPLSPTLAQRWTKLKQRVAHNFDRRIRTHGAAPAALDYGSWTSQHTRFAAIADALPPHIDTLLDVGCGFADLAAFLAERPVAPRRYAGLDLSPAALEQAARRAPAAALIAGDIFTDDWRAALHAPPPQRFDVVVANGLCYCWGADARPLVHAFLARLYDLADRLVIFTALSTFADDQNPTDWYADPAELLHFARTLTPRLSLRCDYLPHDCMLLLHRPAEDRP